MRAHGKNINNSETINVQQLWVCICMRERLKCTRRYGHLKINSVLNLMSLKIQKVKQPQKITTFWQKWKENCEALFTKYSNTCASTTHCDDNEQDKSSVTTDEDDEELVHLKSEVELAVKQFKNGKAT